MSFALLVCSALHNHVVYLFLLLILFFSSTLLHNVHLFHSAALDCSFTHWSSPFFPPSILSCIVHYAAEGTIFFSTVYEWASIWLKPICIIPLPLWEFSLSRFVIPQHAMSGISWAMCFWLSVSSWVLFPPFLLVVEQREKSVREACSMSHPSPRGTLFGDSANCKGGHCVVGLSLHKTKELALRLSLYFFLTQGRALLSVSHSLCLCLCRSLSDQMVGGERNSYCQSSPQMASQMLALILYRVQTLASVARMSTGWVAFV